MIAGSKNDELHSSKTIEGEVTPPENLALLVELVTVSGCTGLGIKYCTV